MKYGIISDVHANLEALEAVRSDMILHYPGINRIANLGDSVGYMANPNEVMDELDKIVDINVIGNQDEAAGGVREISGFNMMAALSLGWTRGNLNEKNRIRLRELLNDGRYQIREGKVLFAHSTPHNPQDMKFIESEESAWEHFFSRPEYDGTFAFVGHKHFPQLYYTKSSEPSSSDICGRLTLNGRPTERKVKKFDLIDAKRALVVVPSVGQPRDRCPMSGYVVYDDQSRQVDFVRVPYDLQKTQETMRKAGMSEVLIERLNLGY